MSKSSADRKYANLMYLILAFVGIILILISINYDFLGHSMFVKELGYALLIAAIVILTVEKYARQEHAKAAEELIRDINNDLFQAVYGRYIPEEVFQEVEKCLFCNSIYRIKHEVNYTITLVEMAEDDRRDHPRHVRCLAESRYTLKNTSNSPVEHNVTLEIERPIDIGWDDECRINSVQIDGKSLCNDEISRYSNLSDEQLVFSYPVTIPKGSELKVATSANMLKRTVDSEIWVSRIPSNGIKLTVSTPDQCLEVFATAKHSQQLEKVLDNKATKSWELNHGVFPYQSIVFWWRKVQE